MNDEERTELIELVKRYRDQSYVWYSAFTILADQLHMSREERRRMFDALLEALVTNSAND